MARHNPVDPNQLLKALSSLLNKEGGIKGPTEVTKILILMKSAKKMVSRCIYMNILIATKDRAVQEKFTTEGGWELLNTWLQDAKTEEYNPVIMELIKVFKELPVTIDILKKNNTAKIIKSFCKAEGEDELKAMADDLVTTWKGVIRTSNEKVDRDKERSPSVKKKLKAKKVEKTPSYDRDADDESEEPLAKKSRLGSVDGERMDTGDGSKPSRVRHLSDSKSPKADAGRASRRKGSSEEPVKKEEEEKKETVKKKRAAIMRPAHTKMRSTGLEKGSELPLPKIKKKTPSAPPVPPPKTEKPIPTLTIRKDGPIFSKSLSPTEKRPKPDEIVKPKQEVGKIKIIPAKHKLQESSGFLDALNAPSLLTKKKIPKKVVRTNSTGSNKAKSPTPPEEIKVEPPKFSFYSSNQPAEEERKEEETEKKAEPAVKEEGDMGDDWNEDRPISVGKSNLKFGPSKSKKKVRWKEETDLVDVYYFVLDETERVNVNKLKDFQDAMQIEKMMEKQAIKNAIKMGHADEEEKTNGNTTMEYFPWRRPARIDLPGLVVTHGANSQEKVVQAKREQTVLREIFFDQMNLPLTPKEPDPESKRNLEETRLIPLEDESNPDSSIPEPAFHPDQSHFMPQAPGGMGHGMGNQGLLGHGPGGHPPMGHQGPPPGGSPRGPTQGQYRPQGQGNTPPSPNTTIKNVQNLLATLSEGGTENAGSDLLKKENLDKLKEMLEPFKNQNPGGSPGGNPPQFHPGQGPGPGPGGPGPGPGPGNFGPPNDHGGPFPPMGPGGPMGMGPGPGHGPGPGPPLGPPFDGPGMGPGGPFHPRFGPGPGPNFPGPRGMGPPGRGGGFHDMGRGHPPDRGMGPRGPWRGGRGGKHGGGKAVCYHFQSERGCIRGSKCHFLHVHADKAS